MYLGFSLSLLIGLELTVAVVSANEHDSAKCQLKLGFVAGDKFQLSWLVEIAWNYALKSFDVARRKNNNNLRAASSVANIAVKLAFWRYQIVYIGRQIDIFILTLLVTFRGIAGPFVW